MTGIKEPTPSDPAPDDSQVDFQRLDRELLENTEHLPDHKTDFAKARLWAAIENTLQSLPQDGDREVQAARNVLTCARDLIEPISSLKERDLDPLSGLLKNTRDGAIDFLDGVKTLVNADLLTANGKVVLEGLRRIYVHTPFLLEQARYRVAYPHDSPENPPKPDSDFGMLAIKIVRNIHSFGDPYLKKRYPGAPAKFTYPVDAGIDFGGGGSIEIVSIPKDGTTRVTVHPPKAVKGQQKPKAYVMQNQSQLLIGRPLSINSVFGVPLQTADLIGDYTFVIEPDVALPDDTTSRAAYLLVQDSKGELFIFDRGAFNPFGVYERKFRGGKAMRENIRFDPKDTVNDLGHFTNGQTYYNESEEPDDSDEKKN